MTKIRMTLFEIIISFFLLILYFQNWLIQINKIFSYADEILALFLLIYFIFNSRKVSKKNAQIFLLTGIIILGVLFFNFEYKIQNKSIAIIEDILSMFKFIFIYLGMQTYINKNNIKVNSILKFIIFFVKIYTLLLSVFALLNVFFNIGMSAGIRYGLRSFAFIYGTPGHIINQMTYNILLLGAEKEYFNKKNKIWNIITIFVMISTLKTRAFILALVYIMLHYFFIWRKKKKIGLEIGMILILVILTGYSQFEHYFLNEGTPRQMFVSGAIKLTKEYFPLGTGFGTYGSSAAADYYSPLYYKLGFSNRWGMTPKTNYFLNDNYIPMVITQFGIIFTTLFLLLLYKFCKEVIKDEKHFKTGNTRAMTYFVLADILFSSIQSSYLAHYSIVTLCTIFILFYYKNKTLEEKDDN